MIDSQTVENTDRETLDERMAEDCPEGGEYHEEHIPETQFSDRENVVVETVCAYCGKVLGEWASTKGAEEPLEAHAVNECPHCGDLVVYYPSQGRATHYVDSTAWHERCWYKEKYGFEETGEDAPRTANNNDPFHLHREVETEIVGETFRWDEYVHTGPFPDHARHNLPTRDELDPRQLEQLREWATGENPTGDRKADEYDFSVGEFPARFILIGGYASDMPKKWICPNCGEIVDVKEQDTRHSVDLNAECDNCGSDRWLTAGKPIEESATDAFEPLSDRERQVIILDTLGRRTDKEIAEALGVQPSTVREYRERAKEKAKRGKDLYDKLVTFDVLDDE